MEISPVCNQGVTSDFCLNTPVSGPTAGQNPITKNIIRTKEHPKQIRNQFVAKYHICISLCAR